jgi:hypothetical protein
MAGGGLNRNYPEGTMGSGRMRDKGAKKNCRNRVDFIQSMRN